MDTTRDTKPFHELMDQLCAALRDGFKASDAMRDAYWIALRDVAFSEVKANVQRIIATATKDTPFPRPAMLRNRPAGIVAPAVSAAHDKIERESVRTWRELRQRDPVRFEIEFRTAHAETVLAALPPDDPTCDEWTYEVRRWRSLRYAPHAEQEAAVKRYLAK